MPVEIMFLPSWWFLVLARCLTGHAVIVPF